jgi:hypothetical protein
MEKKKGSRGQLKWLNYSLFIQYSNIESSGPVREVYLAVCYGWCEIVLSFQEFLLPANAFSRA